ncbi:acyl-CoA thioesterase domain-containing protein [Nocardioides pacificus]
MELTYFRLDGEALVPTDVARSGWGADHIHGVAVSGALARGIEMCLDATGRDDLQAARYTADLFRAVTTQPCVVTAEVVREGPRLCLIDAVLTQDGRPAARASAIFLKPTQNAPGEVWSPAERPVPPPEDVVPPSDEPRVPFLSSAAGWSQDFREHQNASHKQSWTNAVPVVDGEPITPFQAVAACADGINLVSNWGTGGVEYINTDITLTLARPPVGVEIGLSAMDRVENAGIAVGTAAVFDRAGPLGNVVATSLANAKRAVDLAGKMAEDESRRSANV